MGLLHEIFAIKEVIAYETNATWQPAEVKKNIIQNSIYGVDIERGAVDIARLRFWLSLVVDEKMPQPLPNLDYKIVVGNSLVSKFEDEVIDIDWAIKEGTQGNLFGSDNDENRKTLLKNISKKQRDYFNAESIDKKRCALDIRNLKIDLLINQLELMIRTQGVDKYDEKSKNAKISYPKWLNTEGWRTTIQKLKALKTQAEKPLNHFDWKLNFPEILNPFFGNETEGFDIVIGNPPYVSGAKFKELNSYFRQNYETAQYQLDLYIFFIEKAVKILNHNGVISYITPNSWLKNMMMSDCRKFMLKNLSFVTISPNIANAFEAQVDTTVFVAKKSPIISKINIVDFIGNQFNTVRTVEQSQFLENDKFIFDVGVNDKVSLILKEIKNGSINLETSFDIVRGINPYDALRGQSKETIANKLYHSDFKKDETFVPEIRGRHISKYYHKWNEKFFISYGSWLAAPRDERYFKGKRIVLREILGETFVCTMISEDLKIDRSLYIALPKNESVNVEYVLGILASRMLAWFFRYEKNEFDQLFPKIRLDEFKKLPIKIGSIENQKTIAYLVILVLGIKQSTSSVSASIYPYFERVLDGMVCELYFSEEMVSKGLDIIGLVTSDLEGLPAFSSLGDADKAAQIEALYAKWTASGSAIQARLDLMRERSPDVLGVILGGK